MRLKRCDKPDCLRKVTVGTRYCCTPCGVAAEGEYEVHEHSLGCDERRRVRGEWKDWGHLSGLDRPTEIDEQEGEDGVRVNQQAHASQRRVTQFTTAVLELAEEEGLDSVELSLALADLGASLQRRRFNQKYGLRSPGE